MESRPIPIQELKSGEFYDIQSIDKNPRYLGALLLEKHQKHRAKLLLMNSSGFDRFTVLDTRILLNWRALQINTIQLGTVYPYHTFTPLPNKILHWPNNFEGEELINKISEEMYGAVRKGRWVFNLPHFCEGYLHIYMSYIRWSTNCIRKVELVDLWFEFMGAFFSVLRDHVLHVKLLSPETISDLQKAMEGIDQMSEKSSKFRKSVPKSLFTEKEKQLTDIKKSFFEKYRPPELLSEKFDRLWEHVLREYHQDLVTWPLGKPLNLRNLLLISHKLIDLFNHYRYFVRDLVHEYHPGLQSEESFGLKMLITVAIHEFDLAYYVVAHCGLASNVVCRIMLAEKLLDPIIKSNCEKLNTFVMTQTELFPWVLDRLKSSERLCISYYSLFKCMIVRLTLKDISFLTSVIQRKFLTSAIPPSSLSSVKMYMHVKRLVNGFLNEKMSAELLRDLLPQDPYGSLVFEAFAEDFLLTRSREMMLNYFGSEQRCIETARTVLRTVDQISMKSAHREVNPDTNKSFSLPLMKVWYVFGGSVQIQFIWMRQFSGRFINRLSLGLAREVCSYLA